LASIRHSELLNLFGFFHFISSAPPMGLIQFNRARSSSVPERARMTPTLNQERKHVWCHGHVATEMAAFRPETERAGVPLSKQ
jgi:hypothetical protein